MNCPCAHCKTECSAELLGTFLLVFFGAGIVSFTALSANPFKLLEIAATFGGAVGLVVVLFGSISGAHVNPAISLAQSLAGKLGRGLLLPYIVFQLAGGLFAAVLLRFIFPVPSSSQYLGSTSLADYVGSLWGFALEAVATFGLALTVLYVSSRRMVVKYRALAVGLALFGLILVFGPLTGASLNPARSVGPAFASGHLDNLWVYVMGPLTGGTLAALAQRVTS